MVRIAAALLSAHCLLGCAFGNTVDFRRQTIGLAAYSPGEMPGNFRLGVLDARGEAEARVGTQHAFLPFPWPVMSESGKPLADDIAGAILSGFQRTRLPVYRVNISPTSSVSDSRVEVRPFRGGAGFLFTIREFWVRTWLSTSFSYDVLLEVLDSDGAIAASAEAKDVESVGDYDAPQLAGQVFSRLLASPQIRAAAKRLTQRSETGAKETSSAPVDAPKPISATPVPLSEQPESKSAPASPAGPRRALSPPVDKPNPSPATPTPVPEQPATKASPASPSPARAAKCSVEQILKMKAMALTDEQIRAACPD